MKRFKEDVKNFKQELKEKMDGFRVSKIEFEHEDNDGRKLDGEYIGEVVEGQPDGMGRFIHQNRREVIEAAWKGGRIHGKAVESYSH